MARADYAYPFRIDPASGQAAEAAYAAHVKQMIRQVLLTRPGERVSLPAFGCGLRALLFAPGSAALDATVQLLVRQSLATWLGDQIEVRSVSVTPGADDDAATMLVTIGYVLIETQSLAETQVTVS